MRAPQARELGALLETLVQNGEQDQAYALLAPVLAERTPFAKLDLVGKAVGEAPLESTNSFLDRIAADKTEGGWVVIGSALRAQLGRDQRGAFTRCRTMIIAADVWCGADILAERVPGPALVGDFKPSIEWLTPWQEDTNRWVRRAVGVAAHFWAKRCRGEERDEQRALELLTFLKPMFWEWEMDTAKGVGWGLKTLGRYYPDLVSDW
ncbi:MAG: DNA alkylation repair protein, partial [Anaerolineales bacterium]